MAAEASLTDQEAHKQVEEVNMDDDIKYVNEEIVFQPKVLEGKEEEELKVEDTTSVEAPVTEHTPSSAETSDTPDVNKEEENKESEKEPVAEEAEQKGLSNDVSDALVNDVKKKEEEKESEGEATEKEPVSEAAEQKENSDDSGDTLVEDVKKDEKAVEPEGEFAKKESYSETTEEKEISGNSNDALIEDVNKEEGKQEHEGEATEKESDSEATEITEQKENSGDLIDALIEDLNNKEEKKESEGEATEKEPVAEAPKQTENSGDSIDALVEDVKDEDEKKELEDLTTQKEADFEAAKETTETTEVALIPESEAEPAKDPEFPDTDIKTEDHVPSTSEIKDKEVETPAVSTVEEGALDISAAPDASETPESTVVEKIFPVVVASSEPSKEESVSDVISDLVASASDILNASSSDPEKIDEVKDAGAIVPEVPDSPQNTNVKPTADDSIKHTVIEESPRGEAEVVKEEKATEGQDSTFSESSEIGVAQIAEVLSGGGGAEKSDSLVETSKDIDTTTVSEVSGEAVKASEGVDLVMEDNKLEGDKTTLLETSRDLVVDSSVKDDSKEADSQPNAGDKMDENEKADDQLATPVKSSQKHSNSLISKVKQSIVKVKKAITGKSSGSKTIPPESKDDIKDN